MRKSFAPVGLLAVGFLKPEKLLIAIFGGCAPRCRCHSSDANALVGRYAPAYPSTMG